MVDCVFCEKVKDGTAVEIMDRLGVYMFTPLNPVVEGHRLFIAQEHFPRPHLRPAITGMIFNMAAQFAGRRGVDYNLIINAGPDASQTIQHAHVHYVPRAAGDGLKLPWTDQKKE